MAKAQSQKPTADWRDIFIKELARVPNVTAAAKKAKVSRIHAYTTRRDDPDFAAAWEDALEQSVENLEGEVYRRAAHGTLEPVFYQGVKVGNVRKYSDTLAMFLLRAHKPAFYGDRSKVEMEHKGSITGNVDHSISGETAQSIFDVLAAAGVLQPGADDPEANGVHPAQADD
jgi:hypothetical protein